jgi:polyphosphate kinase 2 (PPK2 family)
LVDPRIHRIVVVRRPRRDEHGHHYWRYDTPNEVALLN